MSKLVLAPEIEVQTWINRSEPLSIKDLRGKVVVLHAFQMLCPGCVSHSLPQASTMHQLFPESDLQVIGLHTVFEHHEVMNVEALKAFAYEYRLSFPIAVDMPAEVGPIPSTMDKYAMRGTPTLIVIDRNGFIRLQHFGRISDMELGSVLGQLIAEKSDSSDSDVVINEESSSNAATVTRDEVIGRKDKASSCDNDACSV